MNTVFSKAIATSLGLGLVSLAALSAEAQTYKIDFDNTYDADGNVTGTLNAGAFNTIDSEWASVGLNVSATAKNGGNRNLKVFDTNCSGLNGPNACSGNDDDLGFEGLGFGNALIIQENNKNTANDAAGGGIITFKFDFDVSVDSFQLLDVEDNDREGKKTFFSLFDADGNLLWKSDFLNSGGDHTYKDFDIAALSGGQTFTNVRSAEMYFGGSGAINDFQFTKTKQGEPIPEPFSMIGAGIALGAGTLLKKRKK